MTYEAVRPGRAGLLLLLRLAAAGGDMSHDVSECYSNLCNSAVLEKLPGLAIPMMAIAVMAFFKLY